MIGIMKEGMDLIHYIVILGKYICGPVGVKESIPSLIKKSLEIKYETEKYIAFKSNKISQFKTKWEMFKVFNLNIIKSN